MIVDRPTYCLAAAEGKRSWKMDQICLWMTWDDDRFDCALINRLLHIPSFEGHWKGEKNHQANSPHSFYGVGGRFTLNSILQEWNEEFCIAHIPGLFFERLTESLDSDGLSFFGGILEFFCKTLEFFSNGLFYLKWMQYLLNMWSIL